MRKKQTKELKKAIIEGYLSENEKERLWKEAKEEEGDTRKIYRRKLWDGKRDFLYKNGKKIFNKTPNNRKDIVEVEGGEYV